MHIKLQLDAQNYQLIILLAILSEMVIVTSRYWPGPEKATPEDPETTRVWGNGAQTSLVEYPKSGNGRSPHLRGTQSDNGMISAVDVIEASDCECFMTKFWAPFPVGLKVEPFSGWGLVS